MKKYIILSLSLSAFFSLVSCGESFLYKEPQGSISQSALENAQGVDLLVTSTYANFTENGWGATPFNWVFGSVYGGDANKGSDAGDQSVVNEVETYATTTTNGYVNEKWIWVYKGVQRANIALKVLNNVQDIDPEVKKSRLGELKFLRSLYFFEGIKVFGPTSLAWVDETFEDNDPKTYNGTDIWPNVMKDIEEAISNLPETQSQVGRANIWAAKSLKAKMLMQQGKMSDAKPILKEILEKGKTSNGLAYGLEDNMYNNFNTFTDNGKESIFAAQFSMDARNNSNPGFSLNYPHNVPSDPASGKPLAPGGCCGFYQPSYDLVNSYQVDVNGLPYLDNSYRNKPSVSYYDSNAKKFVNRAEIAVDPRLDFAVGRQGIPYKDWGVCFKDGIGIRDMGNGGIFLPKKHVYSKKEMEGSLAQKDIYEGWAPGSALNMQYLSVRDMILLYAECLANDNELAAAMSQVNKIRARAAFEVNLPKFDNGNYAANYVVKQYPASHPAFSDKSVCIEAIRFERRLELAMEGQRWFDLARWGGEYMSSTVNSYVTYEKQWITKFVSASKLTAAKTIFPVPDGQIKDKGNDESGKPYLTQSSVW